MRKEAKQFTGDNLMAPFSFKHKDDGEFIKKAPMAYVPNLWDKVETLLDQNCDNTKR